ncbi:protoporphyrinogen oxidase HemJ [Acetobacter musti]|uniref:Protoporphyrinogen IX oxidase n=1 Tax=Acetobacter musti TaxID=864732 RepID=A0ABX0JT01_9PROT|nr:protoporphyrinogen oxidase HemJ [Acetobacter musti]NHN85027.1 protoporphyrinogen oxidase HemJ [Acetobacter musti]
MIGALQPWYLWLKAFHIIALIAWMAATFYLPRLFVYHCQVTAGSSESERFKVMERLLLRAIMTPAMLATLLFGVLLVLTPGVIDWSAGWWHVKLLAVAGMFAFHGCCARWRSDFARDANRHTERFYRMANEVPTVLMIVIVIMVVVKPF